MSEQENLDKMFHVYLNSHGYSFQQAVIKKAEQLFEDKKSRWVFIASEYPISLNTYTTHIDFILNYNIDSYDDIFRTRYLVAECKRANPALTNWCFVRSSYICRGYRVCNNELSVFAETIKIPSNQEKNFSINETLLRSNNVYNIGFETKTKDTGDSNSTNNRGAINDALTQVFRGVNGLIEEIILHRDSLLKKGFAQFIPVIFTTANILTSEVDLKESNLDNGNIDLNKIQVQKKDWIWYQYNISPVLKHTYKDINIDKFGIENVLIKDYIRHVAIVNTKGIDEFLSLNYGL